MLCAVSVSVSTGLVVTEYKDISYTGKLRLLVMHSVFISFCFVVAHLHNTL